ncbi:MAG: hypothetical protein QXT67_08495 [Candidatus Bathyarchaeia archaeon]
MLPKEVYNPPTNLEIYQSDREPLYKHNTTIYYVGGFYTENLGSPLTAGKRCVGNLIIFSVFLFENRVPLKGVTVVTKYSFNKSSWTTIGVNVTALDGSWEICFLRPEEWAGRMVYLRAEAGED